VRRLTAVAVALTAALGACTSSPTPHPAQGDLAALDTHTPAPDGTGQSAEKGPDLDDDGVPDCEQFGGLWDQADARCLGGTASSVGDADVADGDAPDGDAPDGDAPDAPAADVTAAD